MTRDDDFIAPNLDELIRRGDAMDAVETEENLDDYITKRQALDVITANNESDMMTLRCYDKLIHGIYKLKPAPVREDVEGEWRLVSRNGDGTSDYECTACWGMMCDVPDDDEHDLCSFCPNCGADLRKETGNE